MKTKVIGNHLSEYNIDYPTRLARDIIVGLSKHDDPGNLTMWEPPEAAGQGSRKRVKKQQYGAQMVHLWICPRGPMPDGMFLGFTRGL